jgi:hypothetical protein
MAIVIENKSICPLCNKVLNTLREYTLFPPLTGNEKDKLFLISDEGVHVDCLEKNGLENLALYFRDEIGKQIPLRLICHVDGQQLSNPENIILFGLLTSNEQEELSKFNFLTINRQNIKQWKEREQFIRLAREFIESGKWKGFLNFNYLEDLINQLDPLAPNL